MTATTVDDKDKPPAAAIGNDEISSLMTNQRKMTLQDEIITNQVDMQ